MNKQLELEYVKEKELGFIILCDDNRKTLDFFIPKSELKGIESVMNVILDISNNKCVHKRLNKTIYKELFYKLNRYIDKLKKTNYNI